MITTQAISVAPYIHREDLEDTAVKSGGQLKFNVHIDGEPAPTVKWTFNDGPLDHAAIENEDYLSKFAINKAERKMTGSYTITATNDSGTDSVTIKV